MSRNVASPTREADSTVVHVALSVERSTVTVTSGFDHVTKTDRQSPGVADTPSVVDVVPSVVDVAVPVQVPAGQASQTLEDELTDEYPPFGGCARQARALRLTLHVVVPSARVRQQVT